MLTVEQLLTFMKKEDSSDLYLTVGKPPCFKVNGSVKPAGKESLTAEDVTRLAEDIMSAEEMAEFRETKEQNLAIELEGIGRFRVNVYVQKKQPAMVLRKIETDIMTVDQLGLPEVLKDVSMTKRGLVLVVGATGSGKSTTLAAMIDHRNRNEGGHIITIEDPVEFVHEHKKCVVSQREVGVDTDSFKKALKNTLRQAPTVILIGEIRDEETMEHAINFAETGHLCLATLHSNNANQALERIINFFPVERQRQIYMQLSLNLRGIVSQRLMKTIDGGRAAAIEILLGSARIKSLIKDAKIDEIKGAMIDGALEGMQTFDDALFYLYKDGKISEKVTLENADSPTDLKLRIKLDKAAKGQAVDDEETVSFSLDDADKEKEKPKAEVVEQVQSSSTEEAPLAMA